MTTEMGRLDVVPLVSRSLLDVVNERDSERRANAVAEVCSPSIHLCEHDIVV